MFKFCNYFIVNYKQYNNMKEQKIVKVDTDYSANNEIEKLRKDG